MSAASTQCPKCNTTFRVSDAQLQVAKGKVRCGSCLHVFKAADHWVNPPTAQPAAKVAASAAKAAASASGMAGKFQFDQSAIDSGSADRVLTKPVAAVNTLGEIQAVSAKPNKPNKTAKEGEILFSDEDDEGLISDGKDTSAQQAMPVINTAEDYSDIFLNLDDLPNEDSGIRDESFGGSHKAGSSVADESWAKEMLEEIVDDSAEKEAQIKSVFSAETRDQIFTDDGHVKKREGARDGFISGNRGDADQALRDLGMDQAPQKKPLSRREMLSTIEPAPVDIRWQGRGRDWVGILLWSGLGFLMALILLGQYAWMNFDALARQNAFRPLYAAVCATTGCTLPDQFDPDAIRTSNLVVRSDPSLPYALAVDAMVQNTASYVQPFPELELYFTDINGFPVASRRFKPHEYLAGELAGKKEMPSAKSVHISLQIVDPGSKAVSYHLQISDRKPAGY